MNHNSRDVELEPLQKEKEKERAPCEEFDDILEIVGSQGKYQRFVLYAIVCPITALEPFFTLNAIFMLFTPDHWCHVPGRAYENLDDWKNLTLPMIVGPDGTERYSQCTMYSENRTAIDCSFGWEFDKSDYDSTIPSEFSWVCPHSQYATDCFTAAAVGGVVGTLILGQQADKYGRKPIFFLAILINIFFRIVSLFVPSSFIAFLVLQFIIGSAFPIMFIAPSMIAAEMCDKEYRAWVYSLVWMIWVVGMAALPLIAWLCSGWFLIGIVTSIPGMILFLWYKIVPESPRWLISVGRIEEAAEIILDIAKTNGTSDKISPESLDIMLKELVQSQDTEDMKKIGVWTLFSRRRLAKNTIMLTISWSMNILVYYGITLNSTNMSGNQFFNFFILSIVELPAGWLGCVLVDKVGRRWTQAAFFLLSALTCFAAAVAVSLPDMTILTNLLVVFAKFAITLTFLVVYLQGTEIFPTQLRSTGSGFASTVGAAMGIMGPYIVFLGTIHLSGPYLAMGILSIFGIVASAFLPETLNQTLPETVIDADNFGKDNKFWSLHPKPRERKISERQGDGKSS